MLHSDLLLASASVLIQPFAATLNVPLAKLAKMMSGSVQH
jgi:hypothetical protein